MYGCKAWIITTKLIQEEIEAVETWFWRRMLSISWTAIKTSIEAM